MEYEVKHTSQSVFKWIPNVCVCVSEVLNAVYVLCSLICVMQHTIQSFESIAKAPQQIYGGNHNGQHISSIRYFGWRLEFMLYVESTYYRGFCSYVGKPYNILYIW